MHEKLYKYTPTDEYFFTEGCFIVEQLNNDADPSISIARARVEPGVTTQWHSLTATDERYYILAGQGVVEIGVLPPQPVAAGDIVSIPAGMRQRIANEGSGDLIFLAICTPRFRSDNYVACEQ